MALPRRSARNFHRYRNSVLDGNSASPILVLKAAAPFAIPASGSDVYWIFRLWYRFDPGFVKAIEIQPGDKRLVHHENLLVDRSRSVRRKEKSPGSGFAGMELQIESENRPDGHFLF